MKTHIRHRTAIGSLEKDVKVLDSCWDAVLTCSVLLGSERAISCLFNGNDTRVLIARFKTGLSLLLNPSFSSVAVAFLMVSIWLSDEGLWIDV